MVMSGAENHNPCHPGNRAAGRVHFSPMVLRPILRDPGRRSRSKVLALRPVRAPLRRPMRHPIRAAAPVMCKWCGPAQRSQRETWVPDKSPERPIARLCARGRRFSEMTRAVCFCTHYRLAASRVQCPRIKIRSVPSCGRRFAGRCRYRLPSGRWCRRPRLPAHWRFYWRGHPRRRRGRHLPGRAG